MRCARRDFIRAALALPAGAWCAGLQAVDPVRLRPYPQKLRTFYALSDAGVPAVLREAFPPLPVGDLRALAVASDGAVWLGFSDGLVRYDPQADPADRRQYFAGRRYLPDDEIVNLGPDPAGGMWARTKTGVSHLELRSMTLAQKAACFERRILERHNRYGMVAGSHLRRPGDPSSNELVSSDNDGLWTAMYGAGECFRYAVTRSQEALTNATRSVEVLLFLEQVTGRPGFPARSYVKKGEPRPRDGEWHWTPDGLYQWKGDTSSDEIAGHYFLFGIAYDLLPDAALKRRIAGAVTRITDHILQHGYHLTDIDGEPTLWGRWSPQYFETPRGKPDSPLNALELLSFLRCAAHITRDPKYETEYRKVALEMRYGELTARLLELREEINYSDEELAMLSFYSLFRYETEPDLLRQYCRALQQWWQNIRREKNPLWTFIYLSASDKSPDFLSADLPGAVWTLYRVPMDLVEYTVRNSHRKDLSLDAGLDRFKRAQTAVLLPPDERPVMKWNGNPFRIDGGNGGAGEDDGAFFLLPYWMGRYQGLLLGE
jgi:hypothetical protein